MQSPKPVELEVVDAVAIMRLVRPQAHNAIDEATMQGLEAHLDTIDRDDPAVVVLTGSGSRTFSAGGDLDYFSRLASREQGLAMSRRMQAILDRLHEGPRPVIAAINGDAWGGGCELITACHLRLAEAHARFGFRQAAMGVVTGWGGGLRLFRLLGRSAALRLLLSAETIDAAEALRLGLVDRVVAPEGLMDETLALARAIAGNSRGSVRGFLELSRAAEGKDRETVVALETRLFGELWDGERFQSRLEERRRRREIKG